MKSILQGKGLGHPLHPAIAHLPASLWSAVPVFDLLALRGVGGDAMPRTAFLAILAGVIVALLAIPTGLVDYSEIKPGGPAKKIGRTHRILNLALAGLWAVNLLLRIPLAIDGRAPSPALAALSAAGVLVLAVSGYLEGRMVHGLLHPALAHFPFGLLLLGTGMDLSAWAMNGNDALSLGALYTMAFGLVMAVPSVVTGLADCSDVRPDHPGRQIANYHMLLSLETVALYAINVALRLLGAGPPHASGLPLLLSLAGAVSLIVSGYLGGILVDAEGIPVGRHRRKTPAPRETIRVPTSAKDGELLDVAPAESVCPGGRCARM